MKIYGITANHLSGVPYSKRCSNTGVLPDRQSMYRFTIRLYQLYEQVLHAAVPAVGTEGTGEHKWMMGDG